jgi:hypothetical protein
VADGEIVMVYPQISQINSKLVFYSMIETSVNANCTVGARGPSPLRKPNDSDDVCSLKEWMNKRYFVVGHPDIFKGLFASRSQVLFGNVYPEALPRVTQRRAFWQSVSKAELCNEES